MDKRLVTARLVPLGETRKREFDLEFWRKLGPQAIWDEAWEWWQLI